LQKIKRMSFGKVFLTVVFFLIVIHPAEAQVPVVKTLNGSVSGSSQGEINIFKGIPFAAPPVGELRWKEPQAVTNWSGVRKCTSFSASPYQPDPVPFLCWSEEFIAPPEPLSEDCLYLNIWTGAKNGNEKRPVFVWIYGGAFSSGSAACAIYDGEEMAKRGIVFVSLNYRVGPFGFMASPELSKEQNNASGNYGILDQIAALQWVQKNIAAFGGDPGRVTIAGQSAGSISVSALLASPLAKGLFQGAILESGGLLGSRMIASLQDAEAVGVAVQKKTGAGSLEELRKKPADEILKASLGLGPMRMGITSDGYVLPKDINAFYKEGKQNDVPVIMGWVSGDALVLGKSEITAEQFTRQAKEKYGADATEYLKIFPANSDAQAQASQMEINLLAFAGIPAYLLAGFNNKPTFIYHSSFVPTDKPGFPNYGAFHTSEVPFALHNLHTWKRPWQKRDFEIEKLMSDYWIQFVKSGNPNLSGLPVWKPYTRSEGAILEIDSVTVLKPAYFKKEFEIMDKLSKAK
jgi:para-nitrobenzyl esterase